MKLLSFGNRLLNKRGNKFMCGFIGFIHGNNVNNQDSTIIDNMLESITHRGPDSAGVYSDNVLTLGFRRLSILDLTDAANQPLYSPDGNVVLVFNGEIYNFQEIRKELQQVGYQFYTTSDSEVLLNSYLHFGVEILSKLRGMFAFCIWDKERDIQFIARDHFGIKPLYYSQNTTDQTILFGSEIKSFLNHPNFIKEFNNNALKPFLTFQYPALEETFFKGVLKLPPGHYMLIENRKINIHPYTAFDFEETSEPLDSYVESIQQTLEESVHAHKISDVKVGAFLSGGVDSSYVAKLLHPDSTYSVGFEGYTDEFDETNLAKLLSEELGFENKRKYVTASEAFETIHKIQWHMDEPDANLSSIPLYFLCELAKKDVTVVLSGEGADELFGGYDWYKPSKKMNSYKKIPLFLRKALAKIAKKMPANTYTTFLQNGALPIELRFIGQAFVWKEEDALEVLKPAYKHGPSIWDIVKPYYEKAKAYDEQTKMQYLDLHVWLPSQILLKADKMSMAHSLELRVPYLDKEVFNLAKTLPTNYRITDKGTKIALRKAAINELPTEWANRKKKGFPVPMKHWLREDKYYRIVKEMFEKPFVDQFFNKDLLLNYLEQHYVGTHNHTRYIWTVYVFCIWYEVYFPEVCNSSQVDSDTNILATA
jgi:asparagine synthase (glutamine-hydrolysing)